MIYFCLLPFLAAAVVCDLYGRKIPNALITGGLIAGGAYQWSILGPPGLAAFFGGALLPLAVLGGLHYFRMIGAGDVKLLMMAGSFFGVKGSLKCVCCTFLACGVYALLALRRRGVLGRRLRYLAQYIEHYRQGGAWIPYIEPGGGEAFLYFSIPVLLGSLPVMGGLL